MTSGRFWMIAAALAGAVLGPALGCGSGGGAPCTTCSPMEGRYPLEFAAGTVPTECAPGVALPQGPLDVQRLGNGLTATLDEVPMQGTLFQTNEFNLLGNQTLDGGASTQFSFSGTYTPARPDGGTGGEISGTFSGTYARQTAQGTRRCSILRAYTATQQRQP